MIPNANDTPTKPKLPPESSFTITEPVPTNTKANVPISSAKYFFIVLNSNILNYNY